MGKIATLEIDAYMKKPERAILPLAEYLHEGNLALAIGAGASSDLGLPQWKPFVKRCIKKTNKIKGTKILESLTKNDDNKTICERMDEVEKALGGSLAMGSSLAYRNLVSSCLYKGVKYDKTILQKELLIAIGSLLMGSRRGSIKEVFNFNFDNILDWYLALHGYDTQIITNLPTLRREPDVTIYHPHGYLPFKATSHHPSEFLIFSQHSYDEKMGDRQEPWLALFEKTMEDRIFIFVGLSGDDQSFGPSITNVKKKIYRERYTAFWLFGPDVKKSSIRYLSERNIVPLKFNSFEEISDFILTICQKALSI